MITNSKQTWQIGQRVKVGFMTNLEVIEIIPTPGDYAADQYKLKDNRNNRLYVFTPHKGIERIQ